MIIIYNDLHFKCGKLSLETIIRNDNYIQRVYIEYISGNKALTARYWMLYPSLIEYISGNKALTARYWMLYLSFIELQHKFS